MRIPTIRLPDFKENFRYVSDLVWSLTKILTDIATQVNKLSEGRAAGFRNLFINASGAINQRGYVSGTATTGANQYTLDRWRVVVAGQNLTYTANGNGYILTAPAGGLEQVIEGRNIVDGTYTMSWAGTATATVNGTPVANGGQVALPANTNATARFTDGTVEKPQLELGEASPAEIRQIGVELALAQRYFLF